MVDGKKRLTVRPRKTFETGEGQLKRLANRPHRLYLFASLRLQCGNRGKTLARWCELVKEGKIVRGVYSEVSC